MHFLIYVINYYTMALLIGMICRLSIKIFGPIWIQIWLPWWPSLNFTIIEMPYQPETFKMEFGMICRCMVLHNI